MKLGLEYFMVLVEEGSITKAAKKLFLSQQSFSEQMKRLEQEYQTTLFLRKPQFRLTASGEILYSRAREMKVMERSIKNEIDYIKTQNISSLHLGMNSARAKKITPAVIDRFLTRYPNVSVQITHADTPSLEAMLLNGDIDLIVGINSNIHDLLHYDFIINEPVRFIISRKLMNDLCINNVSMDNLSEIPLIMSPNTSSLARKLDSLFQENQIKPLKRIITADSSIQQFFVSRNYGACFCPEMLVEKEMLINHDLLELDIDGFDTPRPITLITHKYAVNSSELLFLKELLREQILLLCQK